MTLRRVLYVALGGLLFTLPALKVGRFGLWWLYGVLTVASLLPVVCFGPRRALTLFAAIAPPLVVVQLVCTVVEAMFFRPELKAELMRDLTGGSIQFLILAAALVGLAKVMKLTVMETPSVEYHRATVAIPMVLLAALSYVIYYRIFGGITYEFFTKQYYPHGQEAAAAIGLWFWGFELARGLLMVLAMLPIIYSLGLPRWQAAVAAGAILWIVGGGAILLVPSDLMVTRQR